MSGEEFLKKINFSNIEKDKEDKILEIFSKEIEKFGKAEAYKYSLIVYYDENGFFSYLEITSCIIYSNFINSKLISEVTKLIKDYSYDDMCNLAKNENLRHNFIQNIEKNRKK